MPRPWSEVKSRRVPKKRVVTEGYACRNRECDYRGIRNQELHALIGYGSHGKCVRCLHRPDTGFLLSGVREEGDVAVGDGAKLRFAMYQLKTASKRVAEVLTALAEGLDTFAALSASLSAAVRVFGHGEGTMRCWLAQSGEHGERLHEHYFRDLSLEHVKLDELVVQMRAKGREMWLWVALEAETKLMLVLWSPRTQAFAHGVVHSLAAMLALGYVPAFTSDGLNVRC